MEKVGILLPIFSLPNKYGIGTLGSNAYKFVDFLAAGKQDFWQILPTNPTSYGDSPYQSFSCFANNPYFIDLDLLVKDKLLTQEDLDTSYLLNDSSYIDYGNIFVNKMRVLKKAYLKASLYQKEFSEFKNDNQNWLFNYAMFMALKEKHNYCSWDNWADEYRYRNEKALNDFYNDNKDKVETYMFLQYLYYRQWKPLHEYANSLGVQIIGDTPIYVAYDSVDVWTSPKMFLLDEKYNPTLVAGVPPDYFSEDGQLWGNPLYDYNYMKQDNYSWWVSRVNHLLKQYDYLRIDHFRGFSAFYAIPYGSVNAKIGMWVKGPGIDLFKAINKTNIVAENLGLLDDDVYKLIEDCNYPGMRIFQFELFSKENIESLKHTSKNNILYPGTHDNNTFIGWYNNEAKEHEKENLRNELKIQNEVDLIDSLIDYCYSFPYKYCIFAMQDVLGLDENARINCPGVASNNWQYMFKEDVFSNELALKLAKYKEKNIK